MQSNLTMMTARLLEARRLLKHAYLVAYLERKGRR